MGIRHATQVNTTTYPQDASDDRLQGDEWNENHILPALSADPSDPDDGNSVIWMSDGTGSGSDGDIMIKVNVGGTTKIATLLDYSILS
ncbi:MAG: hypothetical protein GY861_02885 [bacterium]|nr:hypothetical protein [bacterium]